MAAEASSHAERPRPARYRSRSPRGMSMSSLNSPVNIAAAVVDSNYNNNFNNYNNTNRVSLTGPLVNAATSVSSPHHQQHSGLSQSQPAVISSASSSSAAPAPVPAAKEIERDLKRRSVPILKSPLYSLHAATASRDTIHTHISGPLLSSTPIIATAESSRSRSRERPLVPIYAHWHSLQPSSPPPVPSVNGATADRSSVPAASSSLGTAGKQDSTTQIPDSQPHPQQSNSAAPHTRSFSANLLQIPQVTKEPNRFRSRSHGNFDFLTKNSTKSDSDADTASPTSPPPQPTEERRFEASSSGIRASQLKSKSCQNLLSTVNIQSENSKPRAEEAHGRGMRRISRFFRSSSSNSNDESAGKLGSAKNSNKLISKSTGHLPLSHAHPPLPSDIPGIPQFVHRREDFQTGNGAKQLSARLASRPVTRDGITIPPPLPSLALSHDVIGAGSETGKNGTGYMADPGNLMPTTPVRSDGQREARVNGSPSSEKTGSRPTTPQSGGENKIHKKRLSIMPGRKKHSSQDAGSPDKITAWKLELSSDGLHGDEYDLTQLDRGDQVADLWDPKGDTLVYLSPPALPGQPEPQPSFRISSTPLMFSSMAGYIQEMNPLSLPAIESIQEEPVAKNNKLGPNDLFLNLPTGPAENGDAGDWGQLGDMIGTGREGTTITASPDPIEEGDSTQSTSSSQRSSLSPQTPAVNNDLYQVRYKLYYSRVAQEERNDHGDRRSSRLKRLLDARNLFAFLDKKFLVASSERINAFRILEKLYLQLFIEPAVTTSTSGQSSPSAGSPPGSPRMRGERRGRRGYSTPPRTPVSPGYGHHSNLIDDLPAKILLAEPHLEFYIDRLHLDDVRHLPSGDSSPKNREGFRDSLEAMYLGEKWRSSRLFLEGYLHTVGRWEDFKAARHPLVDFLLPMTLSKLDRAAFDLENRQREINERFAGLGGEFAFPAMFAGVGKYPKFKRVREGFSDTQQLLIKHVKWVYGSWPPKAGKSGKGGGNGGEKGGMNREVLKRIERDMGMLWDLVVNWERPRHPPGGFGHEEAAASTGVVVDDAENELRSLLEEFDRASPPVQPRPMFDMPRIPKVPGANDVKKEGKKEKSRKVKGDAVTKVVQESWNQLQQAQPSVTDTAKELMQKFKEMELEFAQNKILGSSQGRTIEDIQDYRKGAWVFIYAVLQSLPMLVVDAPIVRWSEGCEYFLCVGWKHPLLPWEDRDAAINSGSGSGGPRAKSSSRGQSNGGKRSSMMWSSTPGGVPSPVLLPNTSAALSNDPSQFLELAAAIIPEGIDDDEVGAAYHHSYCWLRAAAWCVKWEEEQQKKEEEFRRILEIQERDQWHDNEREKERRGIGMGDFQGSDYGSGEGSIAQASLGEGGTPRNGTPPQTYRYNPTDMHPHPNQVYEHGPYGYVPVPMGKEDRTRNSVESRVELEGSTVVVDNTASNGIGNGNGGRRGTGLGTLGGAGVSVDDIPEVLLPSTRDKRMSTIYGSGNWGILGQGQGRK